MAEEELKWYDIFVILFGTILSIADPITDVLTLVEFYRTDHKTWFGVGLAFIILPSLFFLFINYALNVDTCIDNEECQSVACKFTHVSVLGCNPLYPAWLKLRTLLFYLKKLLKLRLVNITIQTDEELDDLLKFSKFAVLTEAALESAPQFIIQLYAMAVQQQSVSIIQMVSLPVSFLSLAWASIVADEFLSGGGDFHFSVKDTVLLFVTYLFMLSSRLLAVALFTVSYKWWVTSVLILHCTVITICDRVWLCRSQRADNNSERFESVLFFCLHWLRDNLSIIGYYGGDKESRMRSVSNVLFVIENIILILLFYFSHFPHTWYSLPVTICVCLFAVLGAVMRLTHFYFLTRESEARSNNTDQVQQESHSNPVEVAAT